jgi:signal transduction histidine kinase
VWVFGREQMLRWVFREVVANSLKYGGQDVHIQVSLEVSDKVVTVIEDDGPGIGSSELSDLFTVRGRDSSRERGGGGMALVGARAFLETMRGTIEAEPVSPRGLRTTITLPVHRGHADDR